MKRTPATVIGFVLCALLGLLDIVGVFGAGMDDAPPVPVITAAAVLGVVTLAAAIPAWRGNRTALTLVLASRAASILLGVPAYFTEGISTGILIAVTVTLVLGVVAVVLLLPATRRSRASIPS